MPPLVIASTVSSIGDALQSLRIVTAIGGATLPVWPHELQTVYLVAPGYAVNITFSVPATAVSSSGASIAMSSPLTTPSTVVAIGPPPLVTTLVALAFAPTDANAWPLPSVITTCVPWSSMKYTG